MPPRTQVFGGIFVTWLAIQLEILQIGTEN